MTEIPAQTLDSENVEIKNEGIQIVLKEFHIVVYAENKIEKRATENGKRVETQRGIIEFNEDKKLDQSWWFGIGSRPLRFKRVPKYDKAEKNTKIYGCTTWFSIPKMDAAFFIQKVNCPFLVPKNEFSLSKLIISLHHTLS